MPRSPWKLRVVEKVDDAEWDGLVDADPRAMLFHRPRWLKRYVQYHPQKESRWLEARNRDGLLEAGLPYALSRRLGMRALASGVAGCYGGPVRRPGAEGAEAMIVERYLREGGWGTVLREMLWGNPEPPAGGEEILMPIEAAVLDLQGGYERVWREAFSNNRRNECNRSEKRGLTTQVGRDPAWLDAFLPLYRRRCAEWRSRPLPGAFLHAVLAEEPAACLVRAEHEGQQVGLHFCFDLPGQLLAWLGSAERLREVFPATMLVRQEVLLGLELGHQSLNLGSSLGLGGVARFKALMGSSDSRAWLLRREAGWLRKLRRS